MQKYKSWERQTKRKQFSKASLSHADQKDPAQQQKQKTRDWINSCIQKFRQQAQALQQDDARKDEKRIKIFNLHQNKIEMLLRLLENDAIPPARLNQIRDNVEYLLQDPQDQNIHQSLQDDYKQLEQQFSQVLSTINNATSGGLGVTGLSSQDISFEMEQNKEMLSGSSSSHGHHNQCSNSSASTYGKNKPYYQGSSLNSASKVNSVAGMTKKLPTKPITQTSTIKSGKISAPSPMVTSGGGGKRYVQKMAASQSPIKQQYPVASQSSAISMQSASHTGLHSQPSKQLEDHNNSNSSSMQSSLPYHHQKTDSSSSINSSTFTQQIISPPRGGFRSHHGRPTYQKKSCNLSINTSAEIKKDENLNKSVQESSAVDVGFEQSKISDRFVGKNENAFNKERKDQINSDRKQYINGKQGKVMPATEKKRNLKVNQSDETLRTLSSRLEQNNNFRQSVTMQKRSEQYKFDKSREAELEDEEQDEEEDLVYESNQTWTEQSSDENNSQANKKLQHQNKNVNHNGISSIGNYSALQRLQASWNLRPTQQQKINYIPSFPVDSNINCFPTMPLLTKQTDFSKLNNQSLFFAFYHQKGKLFQYLAAQELKKRKWAFHKKYYTWFLKLQDQPFTITEHGQTGTYRYFDYDQQWCTRNKQDFTFDYNQRQSEQVTIRQVALPPPPPPPAAS